jgi:DNA-nicking Smr family endonuclease
MGHGKKSRREEPRFNNPFQAAKAHLAEVVKRPEPPSRKAIEAPPPPSLEKAPRTEDLFADAMLGVAPLLPDARGRLGTPEPTARPVSRRASDEAEAYAELADLVEGSGPFSIEETEEHIEFLAPGLDRRLLKRLRKGEFALQGHVDLHGMTRDEARAAVEKFVLASRGAGKRCVLIVHGRGLHSKDEIPVLKDKVKAWLERGRIARSVLAFASARPCDGGPGALYVLLRRAEP